MSRSAERVAARWLQATRPIPIDKGEIRKVAKAIVRELPSHLKYREDDMDTSLYMARGFRPNTWGFYPTVPDITIERPWLDQPMPLPKGSYPDLKDVRGDEVHVDFKVGAKTDVEANWMSPRYYVHGGSVTGNFGRLLKPWGEKPRREHHFEVKELLTVNINAARTPRELLENLDKVEKEIYSVLIHEVTHLRDLLTPKAEGYKDDPTVYYNEPSEVRAFMQQVADEVIDWFEEAARATDGWTTYEVRGDLVEDALRESATWRRIRDVLTPKNKRLVLKGVATAVLDAHPDIQRRHYKEATSVVDRLDSMFKSERARTHWIFEDLDGNVYAQPPENIRFIGKRVTPKEWAKLVPPGSKPYTQ